MNRIVRTLLIWLIIAALPMQATAAVINASCGSAHHPAQMQSSSFAHASATDAAHDEHQHASHHGHSTMEANHAHADQASAHVEFAGDVSSFHELTNADASSDQSDHGHSTCSACAACCVGAVAPPTAQVKMPAFSRFTTLNIDSSVLLTGFIPAGLERPPRFFLV
jgi:hypothetical protein